MSGITQLGANAAEESQQNDSDDGDGPGEYDRFDLDGVSFGKQHPTTAVRGEAVALRKLYDENDPDRADVAVIMDDPSLVTSEEALAGSSVIQSEEEGDQFKVVNTDDEQTKVLEGMGIDFAGNTFYGDVEDDFGDMHRIALKRGGGAGRSITSTLDVNGATSARVERENGELQIHDGGHPQHNGGLIEYHPDGRDGEMPRYARDPELRPDVEGQDVIVMIQRLSEIDPDYEGPAYWATVFASLPEDRQDELAEAYAEESDGKAAEDFVTDLDGDEFIQLQPTSAFEPSEELLADTGWLDWNTLDYSDPDDQAELNEAREREGFDPYEFDGSSSTTESESGDTDESDEEEVEAEA